MNTMSLEEYRQLNRRNGHGRQPRQRKSKYNAKRTEYIAGCPDLTGMYDSAAEAARARELDLLIAGGIVLAALRQPTFRLGISEHVYRADFLVWGADGSTWVEDVKGYETPKFRKDVKLWHKYGRFPLHIIQRGRCTTVINPREDA